MYIAKWGEPAWKQFLAARRRRNYRRTPKGRYKHQRECAKRRGVAWLFTFATWWDVWQRDPKKWERRGNKRGQYVMARISDAGPYGPGRVHIVKSETNSYAQGIHSSHFPKSAHYSDNEALSQIL